MLFQCWSVLAQNISVKLEYVHCGERLETAVVAPPPGIVVSGDLALLPGMGIAGGSGFVTSNGGVWRIWLCHQEWWCLEDVACQELASGSGFVTTNVGVLRMWLCH